MNSPNPIPPISAAITTIATRSSSTPVVTRFRVRGSMTLRLGEQLLAPERALLDASGAGEDAGPDVLDVLVQRVLAQPALDRHELAPRVALVGHEEQPGVQPAEPVA